MNQIRPIVAFMCTDGGCEWIVPILVGSFVVAALLVVAAVVVVVKLFNQVRADPAMTRRAILWRYVVIMGCLWYLASAGGVVLNWMR